MQIPETLIGTAIATAMLPTLSELFASKQFDVLATKIEKAGRIMLALTIPIAVVAGVVLSPLVERFFGFSAANTQRVVDVSRVFMAGIIGHSLVELFVRSFYSVQKPFFPTFGAGLTMLLFLGLGVVLYQPFQAVGIAAANTIAYAIQAGFLFIFLRTEFLKPIVIWPTLLRGLAGAVLGGAVAMGILYFRSGFLFALLAFLIGIAAAALLVRVDLKELNSL